MTNEERIYKLCECLINVVGYLPPGTEWIEDEIKSVMEDIEE